MFPGTGQWLQACGGLPEEAVPPRCVYCNRYTHYKDHTLPAHERSNEWNYKKTTNAFQQQLFSASVIVSSLFGALGGSPHEALNVGSFGGSVNGAREKTMWLLAVVSVTFCSHGCAKKKNEKQKSKIE
eukprot:TRINITY_DN3415_c0_g5_i4.p2 TRINITY_DN3415_c0_g5~~TRINITY_DN3415_c0_g5_i4.p2  ORF type:complete len:128 (-),score=1.14 TRINITY_DN3415_c0_g5_i4:1093-1476(-)